MVGAETVSQTIEDLDFEYENSVAHIVAVTNLQEITVSETAVGPLEEGKEYEMRYWIAAELVKSGYARFREDEPLAFIALNKVHWRETKLQTGLQISALPDQFYPKLRRYLKGVREKLSADPAAANEYVQANRLAKDIVNCRLKKIVSLAATPTHSASIMQSLSKEEQTLFENVKNAVDIWETQILNTENK